MSTRRALLILRLCLALVIGGYSFALLIAEWRGGRHRILLLLAAVEFAAAILLLVPKTVRLGGVGLILTFAFAAAIHVAHGDYDVAYLVLYAAAALAVISGGPRYER